MSSSTLSHYKLSHYKLSHLPDQALLRALTDLLARDRETTAVLLAHLAEVDARRLYLPAAYPSMYEYCVGELHLSEDSACKRIRAARAARQFPAIFEALAKGRLTLSTVVQLAPYLTPKTADELLRATAYKTKAEVEQLLAERFPRAEVPTRVQPIAVSGRSGEALEPSLLSDQAAGPISDPASPPVSAPLSAPGRMDPAIPRGRVAPLARELFALQVTIGKSTHDKLRHAQRLLSHQIPHGGRGTGARPRSRCPHRQARAPEVRGYEKAAP